MGPICHSLSLRDRGSTTSGSTRTFGNSAVGQLPTFNHTDVCWAQDTIVDMPARYQNRTNCVMGLTGAGLCRHGLGLQLQHGLMLSGVEGVTYNVTHRCHTMVL